ncbi:blue copper domain-containing protein, partial [Marine Group I thaumarchaeote SCGC AAA799-D11]
MTVLDKIPRFFSRQVIFTISVLIIFFINVEQSYAEEFTINIPFGAFNPELNTPAEVWYDPPELTVKVGDTVT